jgi:uncharacterized protein (TIGR00299 family) protein
LNVVHVEMIGGASGNMLLGAMLDAGAPLERLETALRTIPLDPWTIEHRRVDKRGISATYFDFVIPGDHGGGLRHLSEVLELLERSALTGLQKARASSIYIRLAEAEAKVHGTTVDETHFHEVGAADAILDVAGFCVALDLLDIERVACSPYPLGRGTVSMHHGRYPNPPPATAELLRGAPTYDAGFDGETVTPTGAAILATLVARPGERPAMRTEAIGYGAGRSDFAVPNVLRVSVGELAESAPAAPAADVVVLEATIDDMSPQHFELAIERVLAAGAFDVWLLPVTMKKLRPGVIFGAVAPPEREADVANAMLRETTTLGVRVRTERRHTLDRHVEIRRTALGEVRVKTALVDGQPRQTLEYDDVARIAREQSRPIAEIADRLREELRF